MPIDETGSRPPHTVATIGEAFDVMVEASGVVHENSQKLVTATDRLVRVLRVAVPVVVIIVAVVVFLQIQVVQRDDKIDVLTDQITELKGEVRSLKESSTQTSKSADKAAIAAGAAQTTLEQAIAQAQRGPDPATAAAVERINDIYQQCVVMKQC